MGMEGEAGWRKPSLIPGLLERVQSLIHLCRDVPIHQYRCRLLALHMQGLLPFLQELSISQADIPLSAEKIFQGLMFALLRAHRMVEKINQCSKLKLMFSHEKISQEVIDCSKDILSWINNLPLIQLKISSEKEEVIKQLKLQLERLGEEKDPSPNKDEHDFEAEVTKVLRAHNSGEASTSTGGGSVMDHLLQWLAKRFDSDVETVRREWQEMKEETLELRREIEFTIENKRSMEEELLQQVMVYIDRDATEEKINQFLVGASNGDSCERSHQAPPEFQCPVCYELMENPVLCASGHTFCRKCVTRWYIDQGNDRCPLTGSKDTTKILIENIALRTLIRRWKDTGSIIPQDQNKSPIEPSPEPSVVEVRPAPPEPPLKQKKSKSSRISPPLPPSDEVMKLVASLQSQQKSVEIKRSLRQLTSIAQRSSGQMEIYTAQGVPAISKLLKSDEYTIVEKAADVLEAMAFEVRGKDQEPLSYEEREQIWNAVAEYALDSLIFIMDNGTQAARVKAAQTVVNLLADDDIREEVSRRKGVVTALFGLTNIAVGLITTGGKSLCIKGLTLLCGEKASGSTEDMALTNALIRLAGLGANSQLVEESLLALSSLMEMSHPVECCKWLGRTAIHFLVRCISRSPTSCSPGRGRSAAQSGMLTVVAKTEVLKILNKLSLADGQPQALIESQLVSQLLPKVTDLDAGESFVRQATQLLWRCISVTEKTFLPSCFQLEFLPEMRGLVSILAKGQILAESKLDLLSMLRYLCKGNEPLRRSFFSVGGVAAMEVLINSPDVAVREGVSKFVRLLAEFHPGQRELRTAGATVLLNKLLADDRLECNCQAVLALACIIKPNDWEMPFEGMPFERVVDVLRPTYSSDCRQAAVDIISKFALRTSDSRIVWEKNAIELLLDIVRHDLGAEYKKKAADSLINLAIQDHTICSSLGGEGLLMLIQFGNQQGGEFSEKVIQLLSAFSKGSDDTMDYVMEVGGVAMLLDALERGKMKAEAAVALKSLVTYMPAREFAITAGLIEKAIKSIKGGSGRTCSPKLVEALAIILDNKNNAERIRILDGIQALVLVLTVANVEEKRLAASALAKLMRLDHESLGILGQLGGIRLLKDLLTMEAEEREPPLNFGSHVEALEALSAAMESQDNVKLVLGENCVQLLVSMLSNGSPEAEELVLDVLLKLSRETQKSQDASLITNFMVENLPKQVLRVVQTDSTSSVSSVQSAICIIRNISLFGATARAAMLEEGEGVVKVLLQRIRHHEANGSSPIVQVAVVSLERFMLESRGRLTLFEGDGISLMVRVLLHEKATPGRSKSFATRILVMVASDEQSGKEMCSAIYEANVVPGLRDLLEFGPKSDCKSQAAILLKYLVLHGPRADVCRSIRDSGCIPKLQDLKADRECVEAASDALETIRKYDKDSKKQVLWFRSSRAS